MVGNTIIAMKILNTFINSIKAVNLKIADLYEGKENGMDDEDNENLDS